MGDPAVMNDRPANIRMRLVATVALILAIGFMVTTFLSYQVSRDSIRQGLIESELPLTSDTIYSEIQRDLLRPVFIASLMANDTFVKDWILAGENDELVIRRYLRELRDQYGVFTSFLIPETSRRYYHFSGTSRTVREDREDDAWYFRARDMTTDYEINVDENEEQNGLLTVFINHRILDYDGKFLGLTGVGLDVQTVAGIIDRYQADYGRHIYFLDAKGVIRLRSEGAPIDTALLADAAGLDTVAADIQTADQEVFEYDVGGEHYLMTVRYIPELDWRVLVEQRESALTEALTRSAFANLAIGVFAIILTTTAIGMTLSIYHTRLEHMATTDRLTNVANRAVLDSALDHALRRAGRTGAPMSLLMADLDHFKSVNDRFGHLTGDTVLKSVAASISNAVRDSDLVCRWGGEEFAILAENCTLDDARGLAEKVRTAVSETVRVDPAGERTITLSIGVAEAHKDETAEAFVRRADAALYQAKKSGRDRVIAATTPDAGSTA
jgi:diguanylate cyclase (GGDEF)-like protein